MRRGIAEIGGNQPRRGGLRLGVILDGAGTTADGWRRPGVQPDASIDIRTYVREAQRAEAALLDFVFIADTLFITPDSAPHLLNRLEPVTLLSAVATHTSRIGLVATISTLFTEPFTMARQLASLDLISDGRAAWNIVTSAVPAAAMNHSRPRDFAMKDRYQRAAEHVGICQALWDSWEGDAFVYDKANGIYFDRDKLHPLDFTGDYYSVAGPLNIQGSRQQRPVLFQAGASHNGRDLAARFGDGIFAMASSMAAGKEYADDVRARAVGFGRAGDEIVFMPRISPIVAATETDVAELYRETTRLANIDDALQVLGLFLNSPELVRQALDAPFPEIALTPAPAGSARPDRLSYIETTSPERFVAGVRQRRLTLREAAQEFMTPRTEFMGTPDQVAGALERWFRAEAADGFIIRGGDFEAFSRLCIPLLQERGLCRTRYEAGTLRGNLGLPPVRNRYAAARRQTVSAD